MASLFKDLFYKKEQPRAIKHITKPKWLVGVSIRRCEGCFKVEPWTSGTVIVKDREKFKSTYQKTGTYNKKMLNMLGECKIDFTVLVNKLDINQCFSLSKPVLLNRINKEGNNGELYVKYEETDGHIIRIAKRNNDVVIQASIKKDEELVINDMAVSMLLGPDAITRLYGNPTIQLWLNKNKAYNQNKSVNITNIIFMWGDLTTKYELSLTCDVDNKNLFFEIIVH